MTLTIEQIMASSGSTRTNAERAYKPLVWAMSKRGISSQVQQSGFLATLGAESGGFRTMTENLNYSVAGLKNVFGKYFKEPGKAERYARQPQKIANLVYANRLGNGPEASGDGWRYRGGGWIQLTFHDNYVKFGAMAGYPNLVNDPDRIRVDMELSADVAAAFWVTSGCNDIIDQNHTIIEERKRVNGGTNGLTETQKLWEAGLRSMGIHWSQTKRPVGQAA